MKSLCKTLRMLYVFFGTIILLFIFHDFSLAESVVDEGSPMMYIEPLQDLPDNTDPLGWTALNYDTSQDEGKGDGGNGSLGWQVGTYGVGYGDDDDNTTIDNDSDIFSVYTRSEFDVADINEVVSMTLEVDYDDGFIAWINGVEVARSPSMSGLTPTWDIVSSFGHEASGVNDDMPIYETFDASLFTDVLVNGKNVLAVAVWNLSPTSSDLTLIPKLSLFYSTSTSPVLTRYPYIQNATSDSVTFVWDTDIASDSQVEYGLTQSYGSVIHGSDCINISTDHCQHVVTVDNLSPGTTYYYRVLSNGTVLTSSNTFFKTNKDGTDSIFTFVVFGDSGSASPGQSKVNQLIKNVSPDLGLHTGDVIYADVGNPNNGGEAGNYNPKYFVPYKDSLKGVSFYPSLGNHDINTANGQPYLDVFILPDVESGSNTERYYSFDYANAHFVALDTESSEFTMGSSQYNWLENDLATTNKDWKFVFFHKPVYSSNTKPGHGSNTDIQTNLSPLFESYGVNMVFSGHSHNYESTKPSVEGHLSMDGIIYIVTGGGGGTLEDPVNLVGDWWTSHLESVYHITKISIEGDYLRLKALKPDGTSEGDVFDSYTIVRDTFTHEMIPPSDTTISPGGRLGPVMTTSGNISFSTYQVNIQPYIKRPNGSTIWLVDSLITLPPRTIFRRPYFFRIPPPFSEGVYYYGFKLTDLGGNLIDDKSFRFTVSSGG